MYVHRLSTLENPDEFLTAHLQINTVDWRKPRGPITGSKMAFKIAKTVGSFIKVCQYCCFWGRKLFFANVTR